MRYPVEVPGRKIALLLGLTAILMLYAQYPLCAQRSYYTSIASEIDSVDVIVHAVVGEYKNPDSVSGDVGGKDSLAESIPDESLFIPDDGPIRARIIEVLKGDLQLPENHFKLMRANQDIHPGRQVVLLRKGSYYNEFYAIVSYPEDFLPKLHCLLPILEEKSETIRIQRLVKLLREPSSVCHQVNWKWTVNISNSDPAARNESMKDPASLEALEDDVLVEIRKVRNPAGFDTVARAIDAFSGANQGRVLNWVADTGDLRAVPVLLKYLDSKDKDLRGIAASRLSRNFPGATGVTEAFRERWKTADRAVRSEAVAYLMKRESGPDLQKALLELESLSSASKPNTSTSFSTNARNAFREGQTDKAREYCIEVIRDGSLYDRTRLNLMDCIGTALSPEDRDQYISEAAPFLERMMRARNRGAARGAIPIVLSVKHPALKDALVAYLDREDTFILWNENAFRTVMDLQEMGEDVGTEGARVLLDWIENDSYQKYSKDWRRSMQRLIALVWIGNEQIFYRARQYVVDNAPEYYRKLAADLKPVAEMDDEGLFWILMLYKYQDYQKRSPEILNWLFMRLGYMGETRAAPLLLYRFTENSNYYSLEALFKALIQLGDPTVSRMESLIIEEHLTGFIHYNILNTLMDYRKEKILPFIRLLVKDRQVKLPSNIWQCFSRYGTAEDIALLSPLDNYWEFGLNTTLRNALIDLREKHGYDLNGPIEKKTH